jgi:hypothetical protein
MSAYTVQKAFEQFQPGDELNLNTRQAKYLLMSGHIAPVETQNIASLQSGQELELEPMPVQQVETEPQPVQEQAEETDRSQAKKSKPA